MVPTLRGSTMGNGGRGRAHPPVRGPAAAADPPSPRPCASLRVLGRLVIRRGQEAGAGWTCEEREVPPCLPEALDFLDRVEEETGILRGAGSAPTQGRGLGGNSTQGGFSANSAPGPPEGAAVLAPEEGEERALAGARGAPALATGEEGERALAGASGAPALAQALAGASAALALAPGEGGEFLLTGRDTAPLPQAVQGGGQEDGWQAILGLGVERSFFCGAQLLQEVPHQHLSAHARGYAAELRRWDNATTEEEKKVALLWLGFLSQCLQRTPSRGGKAGRAHVAQRY